MRPALAAVLTTLAALGAPASTYDRVVRVDVIASDGRGRIVDNLKASDFELTENGAAETIDAVRFVKIDGKSAGGEAAAPIRSEFDEQQQAAHDGARLFAILLDEYHVSPGANTTRVRDALARFVDRELGPRDLVAVLKPLDSLLTIRVTPDRDAVRHAIETFEGRKGDYEPRSAFERTYIAGDPARIEQVRAQVTMSALSALVAHLGMLRDGRKTVLLVSEGLARTTRRRGLEALPTVDSVIRSANRYNVSIYAIDPQDDADGNVGSDAGRPSNGADGLQALTDATDGRAAVAASRADIFDTALRQMVSDTSAYYLLTYRSTQPYDGKFREVQVKVKRAGVRVRARKGYWALWPDEALAADLLAKGGAPEAAPLPPGFALPWRTSPLIRPWFGVSRSAAGKTRVTFVWEPAPRVPGERTRTAQPSRVVLTALGPDGTPIFEGPVAAAAGAADARDETGARAVFDVPPGRLRLRMAIEDAASQVIDSDVREISIRDLKGPVAIGTPELLRARNAREFHAIEADPHAAPTPSHEFSRAERLLVRVPVYAPNTDVRVSAKLVNRLGQPMRDLPVQAPEGADDPYRTDVSLASLAPGEYFIELTASSPAGEARDLLGFRVTN